MKESFFTVFSKKRCVSKTNKNQNKYKLIYDIINILYRCIILFISIFHISIQCIKPYFILSGCERLLNSLRLRLFHEQLIIF